MILAERCWDKRLLDNVAGEPSCFAPAADGLLATVAGEVQVSEGPSLNVLTRKSVDSPEALLYTWPTPPLIMCEGFPREREAVAIQSAEIDFETPLSVEKVRQGEKVLWLDSLLAIGAQRAVRVNYFFPDSPKNGISKPRREILAAILGDSGSELFLTLQGERATGFMLTLFGRDALERFAPAASKAYDLSLERAGRPPFDRDRTGYLYLVAKSTQLSTIERAQNLSTYHMGSEQFLAEARRRGLEALLACVREYPNPNAAMEAHAREGWVETDACIRTLVPSATIPGALSPHIFRVIRHEL